MALSSPDRIFKLAGRLVSGATDLTAAFPHGGTELGNVRDAEFRPIQKTSLVTNEGWGGQASEVVYMGESAILAVVLRGYDIDAWLACFPNAAAGASGEPLLTFNPTLASGTRPGASAIPWPTCTAPPTW